MPIASVSATGRGLAGRQTRGRSGEMSASKFNLWVGRTLWGMMLRDDLMALDYLASRPEVDAAAPWGHRHEHGGDAVVVADGAG